MQSPGGPDEELSEGFNHGGWQLPYFDEIFARSIIEGSKNPYTIEHILYYWGEILTFLAKHICVSINRTSSDVYEYVSNPVNLPKWAPGLSVEKNKFGILDHDVMLPSGENVYNPMRVFPNNDGSIVGFDGSQMNGKNKCI